MAFDHENFATHGLYPGLVTTRSIANLGHLKVEIIIEPVVGGRSGPVSSTELSKKKDKYKVTIRITYKSRVYDYTSIVASWTANIFAKMMGVKLKKEVDPTIAVNSVTVTKPDNITVEVEKK